MSGYVTDKAVEAAARVIHEYLEGAYDHEAAVAITRAALRAFFESTYEPEEEG